MEGSANNLVVWLSKLSDTGDMLRVQVPKKVCGVGRGGGGRGWGWGWEEEMDTI